MPTRNSRTRALALLWALPLSACSLKPEPLADAELSAAASARLSTLAAVRTPVGAVLTLPDAIRRAVAYNLDHRAELFEIALRQAELDAAGAAMLPSLVAGAGRSVRDNVPASSSFNLITGVQNFGYSTSQDEKLRVANLELSWNILDFGLSYVRARQSADKVLIAAEARRRVVHKLVEEVRSVYFRAYAAEQLHGKLTQLERRTILALAASRRQATDRATSPITAMTYRRELIEIQRQLHEIRRDIATARIQLAALINDRPDAKFKLAAPSGSRNHGHLPRAAVGDLVAMALGQRSELRELTYKKRINAQELNAALLELLPGITPYVGNNFDSNSYLLHEQWLSWGVKASWNVMRLFQYPRRREVIEATQSLIEQREIAMSLVVAMQVHVSRARISVLERERDIAQTYLATQSELLSLIRAEASSDRVSEQSLLREELNGVVAQVRMHVVEAHLESAHAALAAAVGADPAGLEPVAVAVSGGAPARSDAQGAVAVARQGK